MRNILAIHSGVISRTRFASPPKRHHVGAVPGYKFQVSPPREPGAAVTFVLPLDLQPGRYLFTIEATADPNHVLYRRVRGRDRVRQHWTAAHHFLLNERDIAFDIEPDDSYEIEIGEIAEELTLELATLHIERIEFLAR